MRFSTIFSIAFLALTSTVLGGKENCIVPVPSCRIMPPAQSSAYCLSLISKSGIAQPTCLNCSKTVVATTKTRLTTTKTTALTTTKTIMATKKTVKVVYKSNIATHYTTKTVKSFVKKTASTTKYTTKITSVASQKCLALRDLEERAATSLPPLCSCYITFTKNSGTYTMGLTSFTAANSTVTSTQRITKSTTKTTTITTATIQKTVNSALLRTITKTSWGTTTSTSTKTSTRTANAYCATALAASFELSPLSVVESDTPVSVTDFKACCNLCYASKGCNSFMFKSGKCTIRHTSVYTCKMDYCPKGKQKFKKGNSTPGASWGLGPCAGTVST